MKILIDTNVFIDVFYKRENFYNDSLNVFRLCDLKVFDGYISALSIPNIVYICRKELNDEKLQNLIEFITNHFNVVDLTKDDLLGCLSLDVSDYEDGLQIKAAEKIGASYIITNNIKDFAGSTIPVVKPKDIFSCLD